MSYVRTFEGFVPPKRFDSIPFVFADVQEAVASSGPWTEIDTISLAADVDPANPQERDFSTSNAALSDRAWYRIVWRDGNENTFVGDPVPFGTAPSALATADDVARVLRIDIPDEESPLVLAALSTAESWVRRYLRWPNLGPGITTESHFDVRRGGDVAAGGEVSQVDVVDEAGGTARTLDAADWTYDGMRVRLRPPRETTVRDPRFSDEVLDLGTYVRVDVTYEMDSVDPTVRDAVAHAAAALWTRGPRLGKGLSGENIGDYSYTVAQLIQGDPFYEQAKALLRPLRRREALVA